MITTHWEGREEGKWRMEEDGGRVYPCTKQALPFVCVCVCERERGVGERNPENKANKELTGFHS